MRYWLVAVIIGAILTVAGVNEVWLAYRNSEQVEMSQAQYLRERPEGRWVKLTGCRVAYGGMVYRSTVRRGTTRLSDVSMPVYADANTRQPVTVVLCAADKRERGIVMNYRTMGTRTETIEGVVRGGMFYSGMSKKLQELAPWKLADSYVIIDEGRKPNMNIAAGMLGLGTGLLAWMGAIAKRRFTPAGGNGLFPPQGVTYPQAPATGN